MTMGDGRVTVDPMSNTPNTYSLWKISLLALLVLAAACGSEDENTAAEPANDLTTTTAAPEADTTTEPTGEEPPAEEPSDADESAGDDAAAATYSGEVAALVVRRVPGDLDAFIATRDAYVGDLESQSGITADREFLPFLSFLSFDQPDPPVYIGLTSGSSLAEFGTAAEAVDPALQNAYFPTFEIEAFGLLRPLTGDTVDLGQIAVEEGNVLEVAWRDLSSYEDFDAAAYEAARDAYLAALAEQDGWVAEYQWVSIDGQNLAVGMTVYENAERFQAIATDPDLTSSPVYAAFVGAYPIAGGYASSVVK
jgi:hypothetical protein